MSNLFLPSNDRLISDSLWLFCWRTLIIFWTFWHLKNVLHLSECYRWQILSFRELFFLLQILSGLLSFFLPFLLDFLLASFLLSPIWSSDIAGVFVTSSVLVFDMISCRTVASFCGAKNFFTCYKGFRFGFHVICHGDSSTYCSCVAAESGNRKWKCRSESWHNRRRRYISYGLLPWMCFWRISAAAVVESLANTAASNTVAIQRSRDCSRHPTSPASMTPCLTDLPSLHLSRKAFVLWYIPIVLEIQFHCLFLCAVEICRILRMAVNLSTLCRRAAIVTRNKRVIITRIERINVTNVTRCRREERESRDNSWSPQRKSWSRSSCLSPIRNPQGWSSCRHSTGKATSANESSLQNAVKTLSPR